MNDTALADLLIERLNKLCEDPAVRKDLRDLIENRVACSQATLDHPTIQAELIDPTENTIRVKPGSTSPPGRVGFLGVLNGLVGTLPGGPLKGWGYITAELDDDGQLVKFSRTAPQELPGAT